MRKIFAIFLITILSGTSVLAQKKLSWEQLSDVEWTTGYITALEGYYSIPRFSSLIWGLNGEEITIQGFCIPLEVEGKTFALSSQPSSMCFFCSGAGPESVMEIIVPEDNDEFDKMKTDQFIEIKGTLHLNKKDPEHLMYILKDATLIKLIK